MHDMAAILGAILRGYALPMRGDHGVVHWARVLENGLRVAEANGADREVVALFALFHDSRRVNEDQDDDPDDRPRKRRRDPDDDDDDERPRRRSRSSGDGGVGYVIPYKNGPALAAYYIGILCLLLCFVPGLSLFSGAAAGV